MQPKKESSPSGDFCIWVDATPAFLDVYGKMAAPKNLGKKGEMPLPFLRGEKIFSQLILQVAVWEGRREELSFSLFLSRSLWHSI